MSRIFGGLPVIVTLQATLTTNHKLSNFCLLLIGTIRSCNTGKGWQRLLSSLYGSENVPHSLVSWMVESKNVRGIQRHCFENLLRTALFFWAIHIKQETVSQTCQDFNQTCSSDSLVLVSHT